MISRKVSVWVSSDSMALVSVYGSDGKVTGHIHTPSVIRNAPIRPDISFIVI
jgi:hypothetical protein